jgi:hypothetical protein
LRQPPPNQARQNQSGHDNIYPPFHATGPYTKTFVAARPTANEPTPLISACRDLLRKS